MDDLSKQIARIIDRLNRLDAARLSEVERFLETVQPAFEPGESAPLWLPNVAEIQSGEESPHSKIASPHSKDWPRAPLHRLDGKGTFLVTAGTLHKEHFFRDAELLDVLESELLCKAKEYGWQLEAWAVFSNHYHFVGTALEDASTLRPFLGRLHADTAIEVNRRDDRSGRQVWYNFWETELTFEKSYFARLNYVHQNAVKHGLVRVANQYRWCSAAWFERTATPAQVKTIYRFKTDRLKVLDDFDVLGVR
jgi:REP-associated tyrosine transposase